MYLSKDAILAADDLPKETVHIEEWGGDVIVRGMTGSERDQWEESLQRRKGKNDEMNLKNIRAELLCMVLVDEHGERIFSQKDIDAMVSDLKSEIEEAVSFAKESPFPDKKQLMENVYAP